ncbi:MAG: RluA family pseudouridine synthase [bacterium]
MKQFLVSQNGVRLDLFLKGAAAISRKQVKKLIDEGRVDVNGRKVIIASWELSKKDRVSLRDEKDNTSLSEAAKNYFLKVVHEDEDILVVEKSAGIACEATPASLTPALPEIVYQYLKRAHASHTHPFVLPLHRLDRPTSGLMVYGKSKKALPLLDDFKNHRIERRYLALVEGVIKKDRGRIDVALVKNPEAKGRKMQPAKGEEGKKAVTEYRILQRYPEHTLLEVELKTGRTHQVRAHLAHLGHPVVGDSVYGKFKTSSQKIPLSLHASHLGFIHPATHRRMVFRSKPPKEFRSRVERRIEKA